MRQFAVQQLASLFGKLSVSQRPTKRKPAFQHMSYKGISTVIGSRFKQFSMASHYSRNLRACNKICVVQNLHSLFMSLARRSAHLTLLLFMQYPLRGASDPPSGGVLTSPSKVRRVRTVEESAVETNHNG